MANNCVVFKLMESVNNPNLYKINELRMLLPAGNVMRLDANDYIIKECTITPLEGSFTYDGVTYNTGSAATMIANTGYHSLTVPSTADTIISISDKQALKVINFSSGDRVSAISGKHRAILNPDFGYMENCVSIEAYMAYEANRLGKFSALKELGRGNFYQRMSPYIWRTFVNSKNFPIIESLVCASSDITDQVNISTFASLITLVSAKFTFDMGFAGALEDLAQGMINNGRTSGNLAVFANGSITYNGSACDVSSTYTITFSGSSYSIAVS